MSLHLLITLAVVLTFAEKPPQRSPYGALHDQWKVDRAALESEASKPDDDERKRRSLELRAVYTRKFQQLAAEHPTDDTWLNCLIWMSSQSVPGPALDDMLDFVRKNADQVEDAFQLQLLMSQLIGLESARLDPALSHIAEAHPSAGVRGTALYALAVRTKRMAERKGSIEGCKQAEALFQRVIDEYPEHSTYAGVNKENAAGFLANLQSPYALGKPAPELKGKLADGAKFDLTGERGKVVILSFSGHWCGPCRAMHGVQKELRGKYPDDDLAIVEINSDGAKHLPTVLRNMQRDGLTWRLINEGSRGPIAGAWRVSAWPTYYVLDREHRIRYRLRGNVGKLLTEYVDALVTEGAE